MCQSTKDGGRRCGAHASATLAMERQLSIMTNAPFRLVKRILSQLRKEGRGKEAPSQDEVEEFANKQKFLVNNDDAFSTHDKRILSNRWDRAAEEEVTGGTWHAIKNGYVAVMSFLKKKVVAGGLIGIMSFSAVTACTAGQPTNPNTNNPSPSATSTVDPSPTSSETEDTKPGTIDAGFSTSNIMLGEKKDNGHFERVTLVSGDQSALLAGVKIDKEVKDHYTDKEISDAQQVAAAIAIEQMTDSNILNTSKREDILKEYEDFANSEYVGDGLKTDLSSKDKDLDKEGVLFPNDYGDWRGVPNPDKPVANGTYYDEVSVKINSVYLVPNGDLAFEHEVMTERSVINTDKEDTDVYDEYQKLTLHVGMEKGGSKGWVAGGMKTSLNTKTVVEGEKPDWK